MTTDEAKKILSTNLISEMFDGLDDIPCKKCFINDYNYCEDEDKWISVFGLLSETGDDYRHKADFRCESFVIKVPGIGHYFRSLFPEAISVVKALRVVNKYEYISDYHEDGTEHKEL